MSVFGSYALGRLTGDPKLRSIQKGNDTVSVCEFDIAVNIGYGDNEKTEYVHCIAWRKLAEIIGNYGKKGRKVYVQGHQQTRNYEVERDGAKFKQYITEWIIDEFEFCDSDKGGGTTAPAAEGNSETAPF